MAYVALSRARDEALIYTGSVPNLRETLNRAADKEMALGAIGENSRDKQQERTISPNDPLAPALTAPFRAELGPKQFCATHNDRTRRTFGVTQGVRLE